MDALATRHCRERTDKLSDAEATALLAQVEGWAIEDGRLRKTFAFKNYYHTIAFVNLVAWIANKENHHPDLMVGYNKCRVEFVTHSAGGISENDFICAARIDAVQNN